MRARDLALRGRNKVGDYAPDFPTDYADCARRIVAACDEHRQALGMVLVEIGMANSMHLAGAPMRAMMHRNSARAWLRKASECAAVKRKWRRLYAEAVRNVSSLEASANLVAPSA